MGAAESSSTSEEVLGRCDRIDCLRADIDAGTSGRALTRTQSVRVQMNDGKGAALVGQRMARGCAERGDGRWCEESVHSNSDAVK